MKKMIFSLLLAGMISTGWAGDPRGRYVGPLTASDINYKNAVIVTPTNFPHGTTLQNEITWLQGQTVESATNQLTLCLSPGRYVLTSALTGASYVNIIGMGGRGDVTLYLADNSNSHVIDLTSCTNVTVANLTIDGNAAGNTGIIYGINVNGSSNIVIDNVGFVNTNDDSIMLWSSSGVDVRDCSISTPGDKGIGGYFLQRANISNTVITGGVYGAYICKSNDITMQNCDLSAASDDCLALGAATVVKCLYSEPGGVYTITSPTAGAFDNWFAGMKVFLSRGSVTEGVYTVATVPSSTVITLTTDAGTASSVLDADCDYADSTWTITEAGKFAGFLAGDYVYLSGSATVVTGYYEVATVAGTPYNSFTLTTDAGADATGDVSVTLCVKITPLVKDAQIISSRFHDSTGDKGAHVLNCTACRLLGCSFYGNFECGAELTNAHSGTMVDGCQFYDNTNSGLKLNTVQNVMVLNSLFDKNGTVDAGDSGLYLVTADNITINGCIARRNVVGMRFTGSDRVTMNGCQCYTNETASAGNSYGLYISTGCTYVSVNGSLFDNNSMGGIRIYGAGTNYIDINSCQCQDSIGSTQNYGIQFNTVDSTMIGSIRDCRLSGTTSAVSGTAPIGVSVTNNNVSSVFTCTGSVTLPSCFSNERIFVNGASSGVITLTLPAAEAGLVYVIADVSDTAADDIYVDTQTGDQIVGLTNATGDRIFADNDVYTAICLMAIDGTQWVPVWTVGTWDDAD